MLLFVPASVEAQSGSASVTLKATVSETVALSILPNSRQSDVAADVVSIGRNTLRVTINGDDPSSQVVRVPLLVRSNSGFKISAMFASQTAELVEILATDAHATGNLVSPQVVNGLDKRRQSNSDTSQPLLVLTGPRISLGGTLNSPNNALRVTLLIRLKPQAISGWQVHLTLVGSPESLIQ